MMVITLVLKSGGLQSSQYLKGPRTQSSGGPEKGATSVQVTGNSTLGTEVLRLMGVCVKASHHQEDTTSTI